MATLYIIATPIGNLEDITLRALRVLKEVDLILCEDTQMTRRLLERYSISTRTESYHSQSKLAKLEYILGLLEEGKNLALVSDAGTPGISDPGSVLVAAVRERFGSGKENGKESAENNSAAKSSVAIVPIPGPSAFVAALSASGLPTAEFVFLGFLPHKKGRQTLFKEIAASDRTMVFYESPHRILKTLESLVEVFDEKEKKSSKENKDSKNDKEKEQEGEQSEKPVRKIVIARELTKIFEEILFTNAAEALEYFTAHPDKVRGEFTVIVGPVSF